MKLVTRKGWNLLKADAEGTVLISFFRDRTLTSAHRVQVSKGWNLLDELEVGKADAYSLTFFRAGMPPGNISSGLGGSPMIPLSDQDELKPDEDDLGSELEPAHGRLRKDGDPFLFSEGLKEAMHAKAGDQPHGVTVFSTPHGTTPFSRLKGVTPFSRVHAITPHSRKRG